MILPVPMPIEPILKEDLRLLFNSLLQLTEANQHNQKQKQQHQQLVLHLTQIHQLLNSLKLKLSEATMP
jgi:hypothetical protein